MNNLLEINDLDREEITRLISEGFTSGILDSEEEDGSWARLEWSIKMNKFKSE